ncbi:1-carboxy-3-chloro-3,4-dihydroxycyclo hexa-1,5-diene dehydrogenase [Bacteroidia bacterium]|nr:1-carboxy-3-chloro-3,4-dihydroxycyclo hexa-1,5-diene dehydrogenase [Bacteroidia bacterium]
MNKIKLGIIGMGRMGITHYSIINSHPDVEIVSVADTSKMILDILKKYVPDLQVFKDYKELIDASKPDAIIVCTPPNLHYEVCNYACEHDIHVFCEKPFTANIEQAKELKEKFAAKSLINQVGYVNRFNDIFMTVKKYINEGLIGNIVRFRSEMFTCTVTKKEETESWRSFRENGGGAVYEIAAHAIDLVDYLIGKPDKIVGTSMNQIYSKHVEDIVSSTFVYNNGTSGTLYVNWCDTSYRKPANKLELFGIKGKILADQHGLKIFLNADDLQTGYKKGWNTVYITDVFTSVDFYVRGNEFTRQLYYFADSILKKESGNKCDFSAGYDAQYVMNQLFVDSESNKLN